MMAKSAPASARVIELPPLETYPDSVFVEDTALCLPQGAVVMRPGAPSRLGEAAVPLFDGLAVPWARLSRVTSVPCGADMWMDADVHWDR